MRAVGNLLVVLTTCVISFAASYLPVARADAQKQYPIEIARQALTPAIRAFAVQTGLHVGFFPETAEDENILVGPVSGTLTADAALLQLLHPNGLAYEWLDERSVYISKQSNRASDPKSKNRRSAGSHVVEGKMRRWPGDRKPHDVDSMIVIGTRLTSLETEPRSIAVLSPQQIESSGASTLAEFLGQLPQVPFMRFDAYRRSGEQFADLRGFGTGTTLVLINGRRVFGTATSFDSGGFDINTVPLSAVQRVEVVLDVPSVVTGADASGGVINLVLKDEIHEPTLELRYGSAAGGGEERHASFGIGGSNNAGHGAVTLDVFDRSQLLGMDRDITRDQDYRRFGGRDVRTLNASPGNIRSPDGENLPGLASSFAAVPFGSSGVDLSPQDFIATAGQRNLASSGRFKAIAPEISRASLVATGELILRPALKGFAELLWTHRRIGYQTGMSELNDVLVPASNAFNPFDVPVVVNRALEELPPQQTISEGQLVRVIAGLRRNWNAWSVEGWIGATRDRLDQRIENQLDPVRTLQALASPDPLAALNPFRDGAAGSPQLMKSLISAPVTRAYALDGSQLYAIARGPIVSLPAGALSLATGAEWRREEWHNPFLSGIPHRTTSATFLEAGAPLVSSAMGIPGLDALSFSIGVRGDKYTNLGSQMTTQYGMAWSPVPTLRIRASYSDLHRIPSLENLNGLRVSIPLTYPDQRRGGERSSFNLIGGRNHELQVSPGRSWAAGLEFAPPTRNELRISAVYWNTELDNYITTVPIPIILADEEAFSDRVLRAPPTPQDVAAGMPGKLLSLDLTPRPSGTIRANGADANLSFSWDTTFGGFISAVSATWYNRYDISLTPMVPPDDRVGIASEAGTIPRWRATASVGWSRNALSWLAAANVVAPYADASAGVKNGRKIEQLRLDLQAALRLDALAPQTSILNAVTLTAGITNLLDAEQQYSALGVGSAGFDPSQTALLRQRFWYVQLGKKL